MTLRELFIALGYQIDESSEKKAEQGIQNLKNKATQILGAIGIGFSLVNLNAISEEFRTTNDQIAQGTKLLGDQDEIQQKILESANRTRASYADTANVVSKLVQENSDLFSTVDEAIAFNDAATMLFKTAGKTNDQIAGLMEAINKSFAKGVVDSETMSQLLEQSPEAVALLNKRLGTTSDQLEDMVTDGKISLADLKGAFVDNAAEIEAAFAGTSYKISDALLNIRNQWGLWVADMDESLGISEAIGTTMVKAFTLGMDVLRRVQTRVEWLADKLGGTQNLFRLIGTIAATAFGVMALPKLLGFLTTLQKINKALVLSRLKILGIIDLSLDCGSRTLNAGDRSVRLGFKEFEVMRLLLVHQAGVLAKETLITKVWGIDSDAEDNNVEVYISFLRKKLAYLGSRVVISTIRKVGYHLELRPDREDALC